MSAKQAKKKNTKNGSSKGATPGKINKKDDKQITSQQGFGIVTYDQEDMFREQASQAMAEIKRLEGENDKLQADITKLNEQQTGACAVYSSNLAEQLSDLKKENENLKDIIEGKNKEILKLQKDLKVAVEKIRHEQQLKSKSEEIESLRKELETLKKDSRRSQLIDNIPDITCLSDENRPTKLAEKYSELFDNEWTDTYEEVEEKLPNEQDIIKHIYQRLVDIFNFCQKSSEEYLSSLKFCALGLPSFSVEKEKQESERISVNLMRQLKDLKRSFSPLLVEDVFLNYVKSRKLNFMTKTKTVEFIRKCVEMCWVNE